MADGRRWREVVDTRFVANGRSLRTVGSLLPRRIRIRVTPAFVVTIHRRVHWVTARHRKDSADSVDARNRFHFGIPLNGSPIRFALESQYPAVFSQG